MSFLISLQAGVNEPIKVATIKNKILAIKADCFTNKVTVAIGMSIFNLGIIINSIRIKAKIIPKIP